MKIHFKSALVLIGLAIPLALLFGNPNQINQTVNDFFGWKAISPTAGKLINVSEANELKRIVSEIDSASIAEKIHKFSTFGSRVTGYKGAEESCKFRF